MVKKILVAFDDSENAMRAVEAVSGFFNNQVGVTLFHVAMDTQAFCEMNSPELIPYFKSQQSTFCTMEDKKRELVEKAMQAANEKLVAAGFTENNVKLKIRSMQNSVAQDIIKEASGGYDLVVLGRRGTSAVKEFFFGGTSQKVLSASKEVSVLIVN
jgi:nucleotide-binding universal stress UspA family protein